MLRPNEVHKVRSGDVTKDYGRFTMFLLAKLLLPYHGIVLNSEDRMLFDVPVLLHGSRRRVHLYQGRGPRKVEDMLANQKRHNASPDRITIRSYCMSIVLKTSP